MYWDISILQELKKSNFGWVANWNVGSGIHLNSSGAVEKDTLLDEFKGDISQLTVEESVLSRVFDLLVLAKELGDLHVTRGNCAGLTNENLVDLTHLLRGVELLDEDAILSIHSSSGVGQRNSDSERETLWNNDHEQHNKNVSILDTLLEEDLVPWLVSRDLYDKHDNDQSKDDDASKEGKLDELFLQVLELRLQCSI